MSTVFEQERQHYPVLKRYAYLDTATTGPIPQYACDAVCRYLQQRVDDAMDIDFYHEQWDFADEVRDQIARLLHAEGRKQILFGQNSSTLFNIFCNGLGLRRGDNVVIYRTAFPAMTYQWLNLQQNLGIEVRVVEPQDGAVSPEQIMAQCDAQTRAVTVCHVDSGTGFRHDLRAIGSACRARGIPFGVDATQSCGAMQIDVQEMQIDFLTTSCYKWLQGLQGIGFAYIAPGLLPRLTQSEMGWANVSDRINGAPFDLELSTTACRFENGGLPAPGLYGLSKVLATYERLGGEAIQSYILELCAYLYEAVGQVPGASIYCPQSPEHRSNLVCILLPEQLQLTDAKLRAAGIRARCQQPNRIRIGIHYYNNRQDIDRLIEFLRKQI